MVEGLVDLARPAARAVDAHDELELLAPPSTVTVVFRRARRATRSTSRIQRALFASGAAIVGRTRLDGASR